jgi:hypothetical protein
MVESSRRSKKGGGFAPRRSPSLNSARNALKECITRGGTKLQNIFKPDRAADSVWQQKIFVR